MDASNLPQVWTVQAWESFLQDEAALLRHPGSRHKVLVEEANALYRSKVIDRDGLSDLLEKADCTLAYAVEARLDEAADQ